MSKNYKDYQLKNQILGSVSKGSLPALSILSTINYKGTRSELYSELYNLYRRGFLRHQRINGRLHYSITKLGTKHLVPHDKKTTFTQRLQQELARIVPSHVASQVSDTLSKNDKFADAVRREASILSQHPAPVVHQPAPVPSIEDMPSSKLIINRGWTDNVDNPLVDFGKSYPPSLDGSYFRYLNRVDNDKDLAAAILRICAAYEEQITSLNKELDEYQGKVVPVARFKDFQDSVYAHNRAVSSPAPAPVVSSPVKSEASILRYKKRTALINEYFHKKYLDYHFFNEWGYQNHSWMRGVGLQAIIDAHYEIIAVYKDHIDMRSQKTTLTMTLRR